METNEIIESGFLEAFILEYFEDRMDSHYSNKDKLIYAMANSKEEKTHATIEQIKAIKTDIQKLGHEHLSSGFLISCKPESGINYFDDNERFEFWLTRFSEEVIDNITSFAPIIKALDSLPTKYLRADLEYKFWDIYPETEKPKDQSLTFVLQRESELLMEIKFTIDEFKKNGYWEIDFSEFKKFIDTSKPIEHLFNISELLVQCYRLVIFQEYLTGSKLTESRLRQTTFKRFKVDEYALAYLFDLNAKGKQIPMNPIDGALSKTMLIDEGVKLYGFDFGKDTFYRSVRRIRMNYDMNKLQDLVSISARWLDAVKKLSKDWSKTEEYLKEKKLIGD